MPDDAWISEIRSTLSLLAGQGSVFEIRIIREDGMGSGYFDDVAKAAAELFKCDCDTRIFGVYVTLNEVDPALLARRANRIKFRLGKKESSTGDANIIARHWLPIDIDPIRPSGVSSSASEHADALVRADSVAMFLSEHGWLQPVIADSGNGAHLLYPIDLPNDEESRDLVKALLELLDRKFSDVRCKVDAGNFNASRIWKVYGTFSRKGDDLPERPHRRSKILSIPPDLGSSEYCITADQIRSLISLFQIEPVENRKRDLRKNNEQLHRDRGDEPLGCKIDLASWLSDHHLSHTQKPYKNGRLFVLDACPFSDAHTDGAYAIQFDTGAIFAGCHHDSCGAGRQRWPELRARYEPGHSDVGARLARLRSERNRAKNEAEGRCRPTESEMAQAREQYEVSDSPEVRDITHDDVTCTAEKDVVSDRCEYLLKSGDPLSFMLETFASLHEGDQTVAECLIHSLTSRTVINSKGLHVSITGESGKGKSHAIDMMRSLIPKQVRLEGRISDKVLFYMEDLAPGSVITLDDVSVSDQMQEILKGVTTSFQKPFPYRTVNKDRKAQIYMIPERCVWWIAKVEGAGDDQVFNRMLTCWIDDSEEQDKKVLDRTLAGAEELPDRAGPESEEVLVCREIWETLSPVWVVIPYATRIRFQSAENRRNPDMLLDLIRTNAALKQQQREKRVINSIECVIATRDDFTQAARLFAMLNGETGAQANKLTKREADLIATFAKHDTSEVTIAELQVETKFTNSSIGKLLHGYRSYGKSYTGILDKCPAVSYLDRTVTSGDEGCTTMRRSRVYLWDPGLYAAWEKGGSVWLIDDEHQDTDDGSGLGDDHGPDSEVKDVQVQTIQDGDCHNEGVSLARVQPRDFRLIEGLPERRRCSVCGKRKIRYKEKVSDRSKSKTKLRLVLCAACYHRAVAREVAAQVLLPGIIQAKSLMRRSTPSGRCQVCNILPAVWSDPANRVHLCDRCYQKISKDEPHSKGPPA